MVSSMFWSVRVIGGVIPAPKAYILAASCYVPFTRNTRSTPGLSLAQWWSTDLRFELVAIWC